jgi:hypothetical protein
MKKNILILLFIVFNILSFTWFYYVCGINYDVHRDKENEIVNHPEFVPSSNFVKASSSGYSNLVSDFYWLSSVQYIWSNAAASEYKKYLFVMLNLVTDLNPNFTYPYEIWQLLLPSYNEHYDANPKSDTEKFTNQSIDLWLKWIKNNCNMEKVEAIKNEYDLKKLWTDDKYKDPCKDYMIPWYLAYTYYWNKFDWKQSADYYKVASANTNSLAWSRIMAAIMQWKSWDREKSIFMFLSLAETLWDKNNQVCRDFSVDLRKYLIWALQDKKNLTPDLIRKIDNVRVQIIEQLKWAEKDKFWADSSCSNYLNKAMRELNLAYLEKYDQVFFEKNKRHANDAKELLDWKYIDYLPIDFQDAKDFKIIYFYNTDTWHWDNKAWNYN